jgi:putative transcriptional regulator
MADLQRQTQTLAKPADTDQHGVVTDRALAGKLLVSPPWMKDPNFDRTVVLMLAHTPDGAFGVVLNRMSGLHADDVADRWSDLVTSPSQVFVGGPCDMQNVIALADTGASTPGSDANDESWTIVFDRIGTVDLARSPYDFAGVQRVRLFAGYSGWGPLQVESELERDGWYVVDGQADDIFAPVPDDLWSSVLRRSGRADLTEIARFPPDPTMN